MNKLRKLVCITLVFVVLTLPSGCKRSVPQDPSAHTSVPRITWDIYDPYSVFTGTWESYELLKQATAGLKEQPQINIIRTNCDAVFAKCILKKQYPDLITFYLTDSKLKKAHSSYPFLSLSESDPLYRNLPQKVKEWHFPNSQPWYFPGGYWPENESCEIPTEGIFINKSCYTEYGTPIRNADDLTEFLRSYTKTHNFTSDNIFQLGKRGFETLEHLFGLLPDSLPEIYTENPDSRLFSIIDFLRNLHNIGIESNDLPDNPVDSQKPIVFIGEADAIKDWNMAAGESLYTMLDIRLCANAYLEQYSAFGTYATLITDGGNFERALELLARLSDTGVSKTIMCGEENSEWIRDEKTGQTILLEKAMQKIKQYDSHYVSQRGISVFPYISSCYPAYPGFSQTGYVLRDILRERMNVLGDPSDTPFSEYYDKRVKLNEYYRFILDGGV